MRIWDAFISEGNFTSLQLYVLAALMCHFKEAIVLLPYNELVVYLQQLPTAKFKTGIFLSSRPFCALFTYSFFFLSFFLFYLFGYLFSYIFFSNKISVFSFLFFYSFPFFVESHLVEDVDGLLGQAYVWRNQFHDAPDHLNARLTS
jgi:hypothetical protein